MLLIPAIDLKDGKCVRLRQGDMSDATVFSEDPVAMARHWVAQGARRLHIVDLNGARSGRPVNEAVIRKMIGAVGGDIPVQLGGGIRDLDTIERYIDDGVAYVVIGTAAVKSPGFLQEACTAFGGHVIVSLDARDGKVATDGWSKLTGHDVIDLAKKFEDYGVDAILYTDIGRDGMMPRPLALRRRDRLQGRAEPRRRTGRRLSRRGAPRAALRRPSVILGPCSPSESSPAWT
ncbi:MAG: 1-(5-phosphoribosyl)-5-[(5-phosphoribosylamino)methylideneamino] imidazole-4-carboxamide isomerase [Burkholderiaceae bacterium]|nr:1-(5-phosphoribosyl)-5-[(5-phosphoribosylamino)methylideneamino] imidazole-4-carboxamide isomerase [Burkholderiaceae bacterium]